MNEDKVNLNYILLCDHAFVDADNKLCIIGIFSNIKVEKLPTRYLKMNLVGNLNDKGDQNPITIDIKLIEPDGKPADINLPSINLEKRNNEQSGFNINVGITNLPIKKQGKHKFLLIYNNEAIGEYEFNVKLNER